MTSISLLKQTIGYLLLFMVLSNNLVGANSNNFQNYSKKQGLAHTHVLSIFQDSKGFLWIDTFGGLNLFNGSTFQIFTSKYGDTTTISSNPTNVIFEDKEGLMWFGTEYGLNK